MRVLVTVLYVGSFIGLVVGLRLLLVDDQRVTRTLETAMRAGNGVPPSDEDSFHYMMDASLWGQASARWVGNALVISQQGQKAGAWIALSGGAAGLAATLLTIWAL
jgi:hypothetical protein